MHFISGIPLITMELIDTFLVDLFVFYYWRCVSRVRFFQYTILYHLKNLFTRLNWRKYCWRFLNLCPNSVTDQYALLNLFAFK